MWWVKCLEYFRYFGSENTTPIGSYENVSSSLFSSSNNPDSENPNATQPTWFARLDKESSSFLWGFVCAICFSAQRWPPSYLSLINLYKHDITPR